MKWLLIFLLTTFFTERPGWLTNMDEAKKMAAEKHEMILLNFSGSDWCAPCIRLHKEIFLSEAFKAYSENSLVLVNADFPRLKKNQLTKDQQKLNDALAETYNPEGKFPYTLLLNPEGKVIHSWDGYPNLSPEAFVSEIKSYDNASR